MEKKSGAPKGNQYARKHGFYSKVLDEEQKLDYEHAINVEGLDEEIALLRVKIKSLIEHDPDNLKLIGQAVKILTGLVKEKYNIPKDDKDGLSEKRDTVLRDTVFPLGFNKNQITIGFKK